jgi:uncharacterized membrane protein YkoI
MHRLPKLALALAGALTIAATPALTDPQQDRAIQEILTPACTLPQAIELALAATPGTVRKARLVPSRSPGGERIWLFKVVIASDAGERSVQRFDASTCAAAEPTPPSIGALEAIAAAQAQVPGIALATALRFPGLHPVYHVVLLAEPGRRVHVLVDGISGEVLRVGRQPHDAGDEDAGALLE